jgi:hypothetical protein
MCWSPSRGIKRVEPGIFAGNPQAHYISLWTAVCDVTEYSSLYIYMSSQTNYEFNMSSKSKKKIEKEPFHASIQPSFDVHQIQVVLNKNLYFSLKEPIMFVYDYLEVEPQQLYQGIIANETRDGG